MRVHPSRWWLISLTLLLLAWWLPAHAGTIFFQSNAETGTLSEWTAGGGGGCWQMSPDGPSTLCTPVTTPVHGGSHAFPLVLPNPGANNGIKLVRWDYGIDPTKGMRLGETYYFSSWYYIDDGFQMNTGQWANVMQWKTDGPRFDNTLFLGITYRAGARQIYMDHWACHVAHAVPCVSFPGVNNASGIYTQVAPQVLPFRQWFHLEAKYKAAKTNGQLTVWQDGVQIFDFSASNFNTYDSYVVNPSSLQFFVDNYMDPSVTGRQALYVDDIYVTDYQIGGQQTIPAPPTNLQVLAVQANAVSLSWTASGGASAYHVSYGLAPWQYGSTTDVGNVTSATIGGLTAGTTYYFTVTASNGAGSSGYSNEVSATTSTCTSTTVTFDNPAPPGSPGGYVNGVFQGINFGTNQWKWWTAYGADPSNHLYFASSSGTSRSFTFAPAPQLFQGFMASTSVNGTLTLSDDQGQQKSQSIATGQLVQITTGWTLPSTTVTMTFTAGWALNVDDLAYSCP